jgi:hypothetical protein
MTQEPIPCPACADAEAHPRTSGMYRRDCLECAARMLAHAPQHFESRKAGVMTNAYRDALQHIFGNDWLAGHARVKAWSAKVSPDGR